MMTLEFIPVSSSKCMNVFRSGEYIGSICWQNHALFDTRTKTLALDDMKQIVAKLEEASRHV